MTTHFAAFFMKYPLIDLEPKPVADARNRPIPDFFHELRWD